MPSLAAAFTVAVGMLGVPAPGRAASADQRITVAAAINGALAGGAAALGATPGTRWRAFRYGFAGGLVASSTLWAGDLYSKRGGPYLLRGINAYGANVVGVAAAPANPLGAALRGFAIPIGPGALVLQNGVPRRYVFDGARLAALAGGFIVGRLDGSKTGRLGVPVFRYGHGTADELVGDGEADHNSYGGLFNTIFLYDVKDISQEGLLAHEFYHVLQEDRAFLYRWPNPRWKVDVLRLGDAVSLRLDGGYIATDAAALAVSTMVWVEHDRRPLEREAELFLEVTGRTNEIRFVGPPPGAYLFGSDR
jgi:hypothetical protein